MSKIKDLTGKKFNHLQVIDFAGLNKNKKSQWLCFCDCGEVKIIESNALQRGTIKSCGCLKFLNLKGKQFTYLKVKKKILKKGNKGIFWLCECVCGKEIIIKSSYLLHGSNKSCGCKKKEMNQMANTGEKNKKWKGLKVGIKGLHQRLRRKIPKPKTCQFCSKNKPLDLANKSQKYLHDFSDWLWLCRSCHVAYDYKMGAR